MKKVMLIVCVAVIAFLGYVSTRKSQFHYERSGVINATAERIFPYISDFKKGQLWNPFDRKDADIKHNYIGPDAQVGSIMEFEGDRNTGTGKLEILKLVPNQLVELKLTMTSPMHAENLIRYQLTPEGSGTRFTWAMEGDGGFIGKLISLLIDCEKMVTKDFEKGISNLKSLAESN